MRQRGGGGQTPPVRPTARGRSGRKEGDTMVRDYQRSRPTAHTAGVRDVMSGGEGGGAEDREGNGRRAAESMTDGARGV